MVYNYEHAASIQGVALRVAALGALGKPLSRYSDDELRKEFSTPTATVDELDQIRERSVYVTRSFIRCSFTPEFEEGDEITEKNAYGEVCVTFKSPDTLKRVNLELAVCEPDPIFTRLLGGGDLIFDCGPGSNPNDLVGYMSVEVGKEPNPNGVSVEVWSSAIVDGKRSGNNPYFHWVFPFASMRIGGDRVIENGLLANTFEGFGTGNKSWEKPTVGYLDGCGPTIEGYPPPPDTPALEMDPSAWPYTMEIRNRCYSYARVPNYPEIPDDKSGFVNPRNGIPYATAGYYGDAAYATAQTRVTDPLDLSVSTFQDPTTHKAVPTPDEQGYTSIVELRADKNYGDARLAGTTRYVPGQYVMMNGRKYHWDGTTWQQGAAPGLTSVTGGTPGSFSPAGQAPPADLTTLKADAVIGDAGTSKPGNAWTTGQYVVLGDKSQAHWDGNAWVVGKAS